LIDRKTWRANGAIALDRRPFRAQRGAAARYERPWARGPLNASETVSATRHLVAPDATPRVNNLEPVD
jgi:hypothetical protein